MSKAWRLTLVVLVVFSLVWLVSMWRWQSAQVDVGTHDIVAQLLVLPVLLLLSLWAVQRVVGQLRTRPGQGAAGASIGAAATSAKSTALATVAQGSDEALRRYSVALVDARVCLFAGESAAEVAMQIRGRQVWPVLDDALLDLEGNPVFAARLKDLDVSAPDAAGRAQALLARVWQPLLAQVADALESPAVRRHLLAKGQAGGQPAAQAGAKPAFDAGPDVAHDAGPTYLAGVARPRPAVPGGTLALTVALVVPPQWSREQQDQALAALRAQWPDVGQGAGQGADQGGLRLEWQCWDLSGAQQESTPLGGPGTGLGAHQAPEVLVASEAAPEARLWSRIDAQMVAWARSGQAASLLLLAADSAIDAEAVAQWQAHGALFTALHQQGRIPGEGAVALWLATPEWPGLAEREPRPVRMHRPSQSVRHKSADALGRVGSHLLQDLIRAALAAPSAPVARQAPVPSAVAAQPSASAQGPSAVARPVAPVLMVSDGDHRASRTSELFEAITEVAPELDPSVDVLRVGDSCADLGVAGALAPLALAAGLLGTQAGADVAEPSGQGTGSAQDNPHGNPPAPWPVALVACVQPSFHRVVVALSPWGEAKPAPPAAAAEAAASTHQ